MKNRLLIAVATAILVLTGCVKDQELYDKVQDLDDRLTKVEEQVKELNSITIPGMQSIVAALQGKIYVESVTPTSEGYVITFSDKTTATITNGVDGEDGKDGVDGEKGDKGDTPAVGVVEIDGEFYWAVDGEPMLDAEGNKVPVYEALPQLRINEGKWQVSYDGGTTWTDVPTMGEANGSTISIEDSETSVTFYINGVPHVVTKELPFYMVFDQREDIMVREGETANIEYTVSGVKEGDQLEVDVLSVTNGWEAEVVSLPSGDEPGYIAVTNVEDVAGKVFVYATNGTGKTDIKSLCFEAGKFTASIDVTTVPAAGGNVVLTVVTNMDYELWIPSTVDWLAPAPETKAVRTDVITLVAQPNTTGKYRSSVVDVLLPDGTGEEFVVLQYPSETEATDITSLNNIADNTSVTLYNVTSVASSAASAVISDGNAYMYTTGKAITEGTTVNVTGVKKTDVNGDKYLEVETVETAETTIEAADPAPFYLGGAYEESRPYYTYATGVLTYENNVYSLESPMGDIVVFDTPVDELAFADKVGKTVVAYGYVVSYEWVDPDILQAKYQMVTDKVSAVTYTTNPAWELAYNPVGDILSNTVTGDASYYNMGVFTKEDYDEVGLEYIINYLADDIQWYMYLYSIYGMSPEDVLGMMALKESFESPVQLDYGEYVFIVAGINTDGTVTGEYQMLEFEKTEPQSIATYDDFIGQWMMGGSVLNITEKVNGSTYNVTGLVGQDEYGLAPVEAEFVDGKFILKECATNEVINDSQYGEGEIYLTGVFNYSGTEYSAYPVNTEEPTTIFTGYIYEEGGNISVEAGACDYGPFTKFRLIATLHGAYEGYSLNFPAVTIGNMSKYESDPIPEELFGKWICSEATDYWGETTYTNWEMTLSDGGYGVAMEGFDIGLSSYAYNVPVATWNEDEKTLTVALGTATGLSYGGETVYWCGFVGEEMTDVVYTVDFTTNTMSLSVDEVFATCSAGSFSGFSAPLVFTKEGTATSSVKNTPSSNPTMKKVENAKVERVLPAAVKAKVPAQKTNSLPKKEFGKVMKIQTSR